MCREMPLLCRNEQKTDIRLLEIDLLPVKTINMHDEPITITPTTQLCFGVKK